MAQKSAPIPILGLNTNTEPIPLRWTGMLRKEWGWTLHEGALLLEN